MKRAIFLVSVLMLITSMCLSAQSVPAPVDTGMSAHFQVGRSAAADAAFGFYNMVSATARHCASYTHKSGHLWWKKSKIDTDACNADPSTVFAEYSHHNLTTNAGKDAIKQQVLNTGSQPAACGFIAISTTAVTPAAGDTTLTGEVATNGGARAAGTYASTGTGTATLAKTFTATGAIASVQSAAVFNAASVGTMCFEVGSLGPVTLANTDTLTVTWSGTISWMITPQLFPSYAQPAESTAGYASA